MYISICISHTYVLAHHPQMLGQQFAGAYGGAGGGVAAASLQSLPYANPQMAAALLALSQPTATVGAAGNGVGGVGLSGGGGELSGGGILIY